MWVEGKVIMLAMLLAMELTKMTVLSSKTVSHSRRSVNVTNN